MSSSSMVQLDADSLSQASAAGLRDPNEVPILAMLTGAAADFIVTVPALTADA